jgi:DNA-binding GntR family transcriptional regulator
MIERLRAEAGRYWLERRVDYVRRPGERDHMQVLGFIRSHDADGAVNWLRDHLATVRDELIALMEEGDEPKA